MMLDLTLIKAVHNLDEYYKDRLLPSPPPVACDESTCVCSSSLREDLIAENEALQADNKRLETQNEYLKTNNLLLQGVQSKHLAEIAQLTATITGLSHGGTAGRVMANTYQGACGPNSCGYGGGTAQQTHAGKVSVCPNCGATLHGIPESDCYCQPRCPDCGHSESLCTCGVATEYEECPDCRLQTCACAVPKPNEYGICACGYPAECLWGIKRRKTLR